MKHKSKNYETKLELIEKIKKITENQISTHKDWQSSIKEVEGDISRAKALQEQLAEQVKNTEGETQRILADSKEIQDEILLGLGMSLPIYFFKGNANWLYSGYTLNYNYEITKSPIVFLIFRFAI